MEMASFGQHWAKTRSPRHNDLIIVILDFILHSVCWDVWVQTKPSCLVSWRWHLTWWIRFSSSRSGLVGHTSGTRHSTGNQTSFPLKNTSDLNERVQKNALNLNKTPKNCKSKRKPKESRSNLSKSKIRMAIFLKQPTSYTIYIYIYIFNCFCCCCFFLENPSTESNVEMILVPEWIRIN